MIILLKHGASSPLVILMFPNQMVAVVLGSLRTQAVDVDFQFNSFAF